MQPGDVVSGQAGLSLFSPGDAIADRYNVVWVLSAERIWRSRERVPTSASSSLLLRLDVGPFRFCGAKSGAGDAAEGGRTHTDHDDINASTPAGRS